MSSGAGHREFADRLLAWFDRAGRKDLPWQQHDDPYPIWIAEIMLQQTQVATAIPYFERFIARFPDVESLARAPVDEVLQHWSGLGYYARGRNLHRAAQQVVAEHGSRFPDTLDVLMALPGIGRSTAGAILAQAFGQRQPILDGNVKRVLCRYAGIDQWPGETAVQRELWKLSESLLPTRRLRDYTQAIMDLGATLCRRGAPECTACPLQDDCVARRNGTAATLPARKPAAAKPVRQARFLLIENHAGELLLQRRPPTGIWGGLWSFPERADEVGVDELSELEPLAELPTRSHTFSHFRLDYTPVRARLRNDAGRVLDADDRLWYNVDSPPAIGLAAPVQRLIEELRESRN